jgi:Na+-driven multidrug efflux pump
MWPRGDALDVRLAKISLPVIANFAIGPLIGAVDLFWVNRMGDALAVAGQSAANQVFNSVFWLASFLPAVTATLISRENAGGNEAGVQAAVEQALQVGWALAILSTVAMLAFPEVVRNLRTRNEIGRPFHPSLGLCVPVNSSPSSLLACDRS